MAALPPVQARETMHKRYRSLPAGVVRQRRLGSLPVRLAPAVGTIERSARVIPIIPRLGRDQLRPGELKQWLKASG